jgi:hypothetical protein
MPLALEELIEGGTHACTGPLSRHLQPQAQWLFGELCCCWTQSKELYHKVCLLQPQLPMSLQTGRKELLKRFCRWGGKLA